MEQFAWLSSLAISGAGNITLATGPEFALTPSSADGRAGESDSGGGQEAGHLLSASALLYLTDGIAHRFLLLEPGPAAAEADKWQLPAGRAACDELPLRTACRQLAEQVAISGEHADWKDVLISIGGNEVDFLTQDAIHNFRARYVVADRTLVFYYPMTLLVTAFDRVRLSDKTPSGRHVALLSPRELARLALDDKLTAAARLIVEKEFSDVLQQLREEQKS